MTEAQKEYYPVTADELNKIKNDCIYPETDACPKGCEAGLDGDCAFSANILMDEVLSRSPVSSAKEGSDKVDELWEFCKLNGVVVRDDLVGFPGDGGFLLLKILKKIAELRTKER